ncbi:MAG: T9SS type A sorting domain-containing protein [Ignavibacteria bacterium]|nr:T9SS type A sorting domain-containing protein [Ignavibacteria bacterium]
MKKLLTVFLGLIMFALSSYSQTGFNSVFSKDGTIVMAVGDGGAIFISYDGGATFGSYPNAGALNFNSVYAINNRVWLVGDGGAVMNSTNGGLTYGNYGIGGGDLNSVYFVDENTGYAVGAGGRVVKSVNAGNSWTPQTSGTVNNLNGVKFTSATNGYACGDNGTVIYTVNGGSTWQSYTTGTTKNLLSIDAVAPTVVATAADGMIAVYNGSVWSMQDYKSVIKPDVRGVSMISATSWFTCGGGGFINMTTDAGTTRTYQENPMQGKLSDIYFFNSTKGWAVSNDNKAILNTTNGGATWQFQSGVSVSRSFVRKVNSSGNIGNPFMLHPQNKNGVFILSGNTLRRSLDRGETWTTLNASVPGGTCHSFFINAVDTNLMIASMGTSGGRVIVSTNYGTTWTNSIASINLTSYGMPMEVDPNSPNRVYLAPDNAPLRVSTDWGTSWTLISGGEPGGVFRSPCDVIIQYELPNVILVGDGTTGSNFGKVWKSTNTGVNWTLINTVTGSEIPMMANSSLDLNLFYHSTWSSGSFWKSQNMGSAFTNLNQTGALWATDIAKDDPTAVTFNTYSGSTTYFSLNSGTSFTTLSTTSSPGAGVVFLDKANLLYQQGSGVDKMVVTYTVTPVVSNGNISSEIPATFGLSQNYPNPFNPTTQIKYDIAKASYVAIKVFDVLGNEVATVFNGNLAAGKYSADFNASNLSTGIYFYSLTADGQKIDTKKMILVK